jgi:hypothetical protein
MSLAEAPPAQAARDGTGLQNASLQDASLQTGASGTKLRLDRTLKTLPCP